jgi:hypothetical protein
MKDLQIKLKMDTSCHHQINGQTEDRIHMICQFLCTFTNLRGTNQVTQLSHIQLTINTALGNSGGFSSFKIIYGQDVCLHPVVRIYPTNVPFADEYAWSSMKVQLEAKKALELARGCQTGVH